MELNKLITEHPEQNYSVDCILFFRRGERGVN